MPNSMAEMDLLQRQFHLCSHVISEIIPNAVDIDLFNSYHNPPLPSKLIDIGIESDQYVLEVARIEPCKNQIELIQAAQKLGLSLVLIGTEADEKYVRESKKINNGKVYFLGSVPHEKLPAYYYHAKVHALPSWRETPGLSTLEAAAMGCNIVTTSIGSTKEYFGDNVWYCEPYNRTSIEKALYGAYYSPKNSGLMKKIHSDFSWNAAAKHTLIAYERLLSSEIS